MFYYYLSILGHSSTGAANPSDFFSRLLHGIVKLGRYPKANDLIEFDLSPVEYVSCAIIWLR